MSLNIYKLSICALLFIVFKMNDSYVESFQQQLHATHKSLSQCDLILLVCAVVFPLLLLSCLSIVWCNVGGALDCIVASRRRIKLRSERCIIDDEKRTADPLLPKSRTLSSPSASTHPHVVVSVPSTPHKSRVGFPSRNTIIPVRSH